MPSWKYELQNSLIYPQESLHESNILQYAHQFAHSIRVNPSHRELPKHIVWHAADHQQLHKTRLRLCSVPDHEILATRDELPHQVFVDNPIRDGRVILSLKRTRCPLCVYSGHICPQTEKLRIWGDLCPLVAQSDHSQSHMGSKTVVRILLDSMFTIHASPF